MKAWWPTESFFSPPRKVTGRWRSSLGARRNQTLRVKKKGCADRKISGGSKPRGFFCSLFQSRNHPFQSRQADRNSTLILADGPIHFRIWILSKIVLIFLSRAVTARWLEYFTYRFDTLWLLYIILLIHGTPSFNQGVVKHWAHFSWTWNLFPTFLKVAASIWTKSGTSQIKST